MPQTQENFGLDLSLELDLSELDNPPTEYSNIIFDCETLDHLFEVAEYSSAMPLSFEDMFRTQALPILTAGLEQDSIMLSCNLDNVTSSAAEHRYFLCLLAEFEHYAIYTEVNARDLMYIEKIQRALFSITIAQNHLASLLSYLRLLLEYPTWTVQTVKCFDLLTQHAIIKLYFKNCNRYELARWQAKAAQYNIAIFSDSELRPSVIYNPTGIFSALLYQLEVAFINNDINNASEILAKLNLSELNIDLQSLLACLNIFLSWVNLSVQPNNVVRTLLEQQTLKNYFASADVNTLLFWLEKAIKGNHLAFVVHIAQYIERHPECGLFFLVDSHNLSNLLNALPISDERYGKFIKRIGGFVRTYHHNVATVYINRDSYEIKSQLMPLVDQLTPNQKHTTAESDFINHSLKSQGVKEVARKSIKRCNGDDSDDDSGEYLPQPQHAQKKPRISINAANGDKKQIYSCVKASVSSVRSNISCARVSFFLDKSASIPVRSRSHAEPTISLALRLK